MGGDRRRRELPSPWPPERVEEAAGGAASPGEEEPDAGPHPGEEELQAESTPTCRRAGALLLSQSSTMRRRSARSRGSRGAHPWGRARPPLDSRGTAARRRRRRREALEVPAPGSRLSSPARRSSPSHFARREWRGQRGPVEEEGV
jgi:hypothetical protein